VHFVGLFCVIVPQCTVQKHNIRSYSFKEGTYPLTKTFIQIYGLIFLQISGEFTSL